MAVLGPGEWWRLVPGARECRFGVFLRSNSGGSFACR